MSRGPCVVLVLVIAMAAMASAEIPQMISYQGKVTDASGNPVADNSYTMRFRIYDQFIGGTLQWDSGNQSVAVSGGVFSVVLGGTGYPTLGLGFDEDYWILVTFAGVDQTPRHRLTSAGYAYMASGLVPGTEVVGSITSFSDAVIKGKNTATEGPCHGVWGEVTGPGVGVLGDASATSGASDGVWGQTSSVAGKGVFGSAYATSGENYGGWFQSDSPAGTALFGFNTATSGNGYGIHGLSLSLTGRAVYGCASATTGTNYAIYGLTNSTSGYAGYFEGNARVTGNLTLDGDLIGPTIGDITAVTAGTGLSGGGASGDVTLNVTTPLMLSGSSANPIIAGTNSGAGNGLRGWNTATTGETYGVAGAAVSTEGIGVSGYAGATTGITYGVFGQSDSPDGYGLYGVASPQTGYSCGVFGKCYSPVGVGVFGWSNANTGMTYGVYGQCFSSEGSGVYGSALATTGSPCGGEFQSVASEGIGVCGMASATSGLNSGVYGQSASANGTGVYGWAQSTVGVNCGVCGSTRSETGHGVYYSGGLAGTGGKSCVVRTSKGPTLFYCQESPENWFEDFGHARLIEGRAHVELDPIYLEAVTIDAANPLLVFTELQGPCNGTYVMPGNTGFDVIELHEGRSNVAFAYRVVAKRKGFEERRLDVCQAAARDPYLYPELRKDPSATDELMAQRLRHAQATRELAGVHSPSR